MGPAQLQPLLCGDPESIVVDAQLTLCDLTCPPLNEPDPPIGAAEEFGSSAPGLAYKEQSGATAMAATIAETWRRCGPGRAAWSNRVWSAGVV
jgi:hypothetical protein